jgi:hypothetical protein
LEAVKVQWVEIDQAKKKRILVSLKRLIKIAPDLDEPLEEEGI